jgi:hypothetical protein
VEASVNAVLTPPRRRSTRLARVAVILIGVAVTVGVASAVARFGGDDPTPLRRLTVHNPTPYIVNVEVTGGERNGWLDVGSFPREGLRTVEELADQGRQWVFRFSYAGVDAGELVVSRDELATDGWRITVPADVGERLRDAGLPESGR